MRSALHIKCAIWNWRSIDSEEPKPNNTFTWEGQKRSCRICNRKSTLKLAQRAESSAGVMVTVESRGAPFG
jgi:hypothetical protein